MATSGRRLAPPLTLPTLTSCSRGFSPRRPTTSSSRITTNAEPSSPTPTRAPPALPCRTHRPAPPIRRRTSRPIPRRHLPLLARSTRRLETRLSASSAASATTRYGTNSHRRSCSEGPGATSPIGGGALDAPSPSLMPRRSRARGSKPWQMTAPGGAPWSKPKLQITRPTAAG
eukprot:196664-Pleurochrysis_carterae.AAC.1